MKIEHLAIWVEDLEKMRTFYTKYFGMLCSDKYINDKKGFSSYFLSFDNGTRIEIMNRPDIASPKDEKGKVHGLAHFAISVGSKDAVDKITNLFRSEGVSIIGEPRTTGDGYYESVILDPERNQVEITE